MCDPPVDPYINDPAGWAEHKLDKWMWSKQRAVAQSVVDNKLTAVQSAHSTGKSQLAAFLVAWWIDVHPPRQAFVITTAPTGAQIAAVLWRYIGQLHNDHSELPGRVNKTSWHLTHSRTHYTHARVGEEMVAFGRKPADNNPVGIQGVHAKYVLIILDEAGGVASERLWTSLETLGTNLHVRILAIGNPDDPNTYFHQVCNSPAWNVIKISAYDTPNITKEFIPGRYRDMLDLLVTEDWIEDKKRRWGEDSPVYKSKVLGEFPDDSLNGIIPIGPLRKCTWERDPDMPWIQTPVEAGIDVGASENGDKTVLTIRRGNRLVSVHWWQIPNHVALSAAVWSELAKHKDLTSVKVDAVGVGWALGDMIQEHAWKSGHGLKVHKIMFGAKAREPHRFVNIRTEMYYNFRELVMDGAVDLTCLVRVGPTYNNATLFGDDAIAELVAPNWGEDSNSRTWLEPKDEIKKRLGRSTDYADSIVLAWYQPVAAYAGVSYVSG